MPREFQITSFPPCDKPVTPSALYSLLYPQLSKPRNETYVTETLTSGGASLLYPEPAKNIPLIFQQNAAFGEMVVDMSKDQLTTEKITYPHRIGKQLGWGELQYLLHWTAWIAGIPPEFAKEYEKEVINGNVINSVVFNDYALTRDERLPEYNKLADEFIVFIKYTDAPVNPVTKLLCIPGHTKSLGSHVEKRVAHHLEIPRHHVILNKDHPDYNTIVQAAPWLPSLDEVAIQHGELPREGIIFLHTQS